MDDATMDELANEMEPPVEGASSVLVETLCDVGSGAVGASACTRDHVHQSGAEDDAVAWDLRAMRPCDEEKEGAGEAAWAAPTTARLPTTIQRCASPVPLGGRVGNHIRFFEEGDVLVAFGEEGAVSCSKGPPPSTESAFGVVGVLSGSKGRLPSASARVLWGSEDGDVVAMEAEAVEAEAMEAEEAMELEAAEVEAVDLLDVIGSMRSPPSASDRFDAQMHDAEVVLGDVEAAGASVVEAVAAIAPESAAIAEAPAEAGAIPPIDGDPLEELAIQAAIAASLADDICGSQTPEVLAELQALRDRVKELEKEQASMSRALQDPRARLAHHLGLRGFEIAAQEQELEQEGGWEHLMTLSGRSEWQSPPPPLTTPDAHDAGIGIHSGASAADIAAAHFAATMPENRPEEEAAEAEAETEPEPMEMESGAEAEPEPMALEAEAGTCSTLEAAAAFATGSAVLTELVLAAALGSPCTVDMTKMKVEELRGALKTAGCDTSGKRAELVSRLVGWLGAAKAPATAPVVESPVDIKPGENGFVWTGQVSAR